MRSKTKCLLDDKTVREIFSSLGIGGVKSIAPLGAGMFNAVYGVSADREYVLKVAPRQNVPVMTYEKDMLKTELFWYKTIAENTDISIPKIYGSDFSHKIIDSDFFVMERLGGVHKNSFKQPGCDSLLETASIVAKLHNVHGEGYGYVQNKLYDNWYDALCSMISNMLSDAERVGKSSKRGAKLLEYAKKHRSVLLTVPCVAVNYDLWDANIICKNNENGKPIFSVIDPERSMWGDPIFDFICLEGFLTSIERKEKSVEYHNRISEVKIEINRELKIRYAFAQGLMALIQEVEKYYRFKPFDTGWFVDVTSSNVLYRCAFKVLENE